MMKLVLALTLIVAATHGSPPSLEEVTRVQIQFCTDFADGNTEAAMKVANKAIAYQCVS